MSEFFQVRIERGLNASQHQHLDNRQEIFNRNDAQHRHRKLLLFKELIEASNDVALKDTSCYSDDNFLNRFLYARKFKCDEALQLLINYLTYKEHNKRLLQTINIFDEKVQMSLRDGNPAVLRQRDRRGRKVLTFAACNWEPSKYSLEDVYRALLLSFDKLLENIENQALGFVIIVDWTNFTYRQSSHLSPKILKLMIEGLQNCMPAKFKGIHFVAQPWYVEVALTVIKPFLNDKMKERVIVHGTNLISLHSNVSKDILPPELGGEGPALNTLDWYHYLLESSQTPEAPKPYRLIKSPVYSTPAAFKHFSASMEKINKSESIIDNDISDILS